MLTSVIQENDNQEWVIEWVIRLDFKEHEDLPIPNRLPQTSKPPARAAAPLRPSEQLARLPSAPTAQPTASSNRTRRPAISPTPTVRFLQDTGPRQGNTPVATTARQQHK